MTVEDFYVAHVRMYIRPIFRFAIWNIESLTLTHNLLDSDSLS